MNRYYIGEKNRKQFSASNKAREDIETCLKNRDYKSYDMYLNIVNSSSSKIQTIKELIRSITKFKKNDYLYVQYPYYNHDNKMKFLIKSIKILKKVNLVCIIHDIDSLRYNRKHFVDEEIEFINVFDYVVSHNKKMTEWLSSKGCISNIVNINIFDYIIKDENVNTNSRNTDIVFAGNLDENKSGFIYKMLSRNIKYTLNLYGPNFKNETLNNDKIKYCGKYPPEELINIIEGKFGLIWDGDEVQTCSGDTGEYTKYNNPHKLSLYIACGLPIICWRKMAISQFVEDNKIGIVIDSLEELNYINIKDEEYFSMVKNINYIQAKIKKGEFINIALDKIDNIKSK